MMILMAIGIFIMVVELTVVLLVLNELRKQGK